MRRHFVLVALFAVTLVASIVFAACAAPRVREIPPVTVALPSSDGASSGNANETRLLKRNFVETVHGTKVSDPYRWLEDSNAPDVIAFTERQNARTRTFLDALPLRSKLV